MYLLFTIPVLATHSRQLGLAGRGCRHLLVLASHGPNDCPLFLRLDGRFVSKCCSTSPQHWCWWTAAGHLQLLVLTDQLLCFLGRPDVSVSRQSTNPGVPVWCGDCHMPPWRHGLWGIPIGIVLLVGAGLFGIAPTGETIDFLLGRGGLQRVLIFGIPAALIVYGTLQVRARESTWTYLGDASYSLYLSHPLFLTLLLALWMKFPAPSDLIILTSIAAALIFAWRVHELIEKPILAALKRRPMLPSENA